MSLIQDIPVLCKEYEEQKGRLAHNQDLFEIYEGDLLKHVLAALKGQLSAKSFEQVKHRVAPINVGKRLVSKLSKIYAKPPVRKLVRIGAKAGDGHKASAKDTQLLEFYQDAFDMNTTGANANEFFNLFKGTLLEPFLDGDKPGLRVVPSDRYFVYSKNTVNPMRPTHIVKIMDKVKDDQGVEKVLMYAYTDQEFVAFYSNGEIAAQVMSSPELVGMGGKNPYGKIPFVYLNRSKYELTPRIDSDMKAMIVLLPVLLSDLNFALMFQCFAIIWTMGVKLENVEFAPNVLWDLKNDPNSDKEGKIGVIKPEVDTDKALTVFKNQLALWLESKNIKPGAMGEITVENVASGVSKVLDEMDTSEDRTAQIPYFVQAERELWDLVINHMHPVWSKAAGFKNNAAFSKGLEVAVTFAEQRPNVDSSKAIDDQIKKMGAGLQSRRGALKELYPDWDEEQIEAKLKEIDEEKAALGLDDASDEAGEESDSEGEQEGEEGQGGQAKEETAKPRKEAQAAQAEA